MISSTLATVPAQVSTGVDTDFIVNAISEKGYCIYDNFLSPEEVILLKNSLQLDYETGQFRKAGIGKQQDYQVVHEIRGDYIQWLPEEGTSCFHELYVNRLKLVTESLNRQCFLGLQEAELHLTVYPPETAYHRHVDAFRQDDNRRISVICYLNTGWQSTDGGELMLYLPKDDNEEAVTVQPLAGRMIIFESHLLHEVLVSHTRRYSITGWLLKEKRLW